MVSGEATVYWPGATPGVSEFRDSYPDRLVK